MDKPSFSHHVLASYHVLSACILLRRDMDYNCYPRRAFGQVLTASRASRSTARLSSSSEKELLNGGLFSGYGGQSAWSQELSFKFTGFFCKKKLKLNFWRTSVQRCILWCRGVRISAINFLSLNFFWQLRVFLKISTFLRKFEVLATFFVVFWRSIWQFCPEVTPNFRFLLNTLSFWALIW